MIQDTHLHESSKQNISVEDKKRRAVCDPVSTTMETQMDDNEQAARLEAAQVLSALAFGPVVLNSSGTREKPQGKNAEKPATAVGEGGKKTTKSRQRRSAGSSGGESRGTKKSRSSTTRKDKVVVADVSASPSTPVLPPTPVQVPFTLPSFPPSGNTSPFPTLPSLEQLSCYSQQGSLLPLKSQPSLPSLPSNIAALGIPNLPQLPSLNSDLQLIHVGTDANTASSSSSSLLSADAGRSSSGTNSDLNKSLPFKKRRIVKEDGDDDAASVSGEGGEGSGGGGTGDRSGGRGVQSAPPAKVEYHNIIVNGKIDFRGVVIPSSSHAVKSVSSTRTAAQSVSASSSGVSQAGNSRHAASAAQTANPSIGGSQLQNKSSASRLLLPKPAGLLTGIPARGLLVNPVIASPTPLLTPPALPPLRFRLDQATNDRLVADIQTALTPDEDGDLPLHLAVVHEDELMVKKFCTLMKMANRSVDKFNMDKQTPLNMAVKMNQPAAISVLLAYGADVNHQDKSGDTCLHVAVKKSNLSCLRLLNSESRHTPDFNTRNFDGITPLHSAVENDHKEIINFLLDNKADINMMDGKSGRTALFYAAEANLLNTVDVLLRRGALPGVPNYAGITALMAAQARNLTAITKLLARVDEDREDEDEKPITSKVMTPSSTQLPQGVMEEMDDQTDTASSASSHSASSIRDAGKELARSSNSRNPKERISSMLQARTQAAAAAAKSAAVASQSCPSPHPTSTLSSASASLSSAGSVVREVQAKNFPPDSPVSQSSSRSSVKTSTSPTPSSAAARSVSRRNLSRNVMVEVPSKTLPPSAGLVKGTVASGTVLVTVASPKTNSSSLVTSSLRPGERMMMITSPQSASVAVAGGSSSAIKVAEFSAHSSSMGGVGPSESVRVALAQNQQEMRSAGSPVMVIRRLSRSDSLGVIDLTTKDRSSSVTNAAESPNGVESSGRAISSTEDSVTRVVQVGNHTALEAEARGGSSASLGRRKGSRAKSPSSSGPPSRGKGGGKASGTRTTSKAAASSATSTTTDGSEAKSSGKMQRKRAAQTTDTAESRAPPSKVQVMVSSSQLPSNPELANSHLRAGDVQHAVASLAAAVASLSPTTVASSQPAALPCSPATSRDSAEVKVETNEKSPISVAISQVPASPSSSLHQHGSVGVSTALPSSPTPNVLQGKMLPALDSRNSILASRLQVARSQAEALQHSSSSRVTTSSCSSASSDSKTVSSALHTASRAQVPPTVHSPASGFSSGQSPVSSVLKRTLLSKALSPGASSSTNTVSDGNPKGKGKASSSPAENSSRAGNLSEPGRGKDGVESSSPLGSVAKAKLAASTVGSSVSGGTVSSAQTVSSSTTPGRMLGKGKGGNLSSENFAPRENATVVSTSRPTSSIPTSSPKLEAALRNQGPGESSKSSSASKPVTASRSSGTSEPSRASVPSRPETSPSSSNSTSRLGSLQSSNVAGSSSQPTSSSQQARPASAVLPKSTNRRTSNGVAKVRSSVETVTSSQDDSAKTSKDGAMQNESDVTGMVSSTTPPSPTQDVKQPGRSRSIDF